MGPEEKKNDLQGRKGVGDKTSVQLPRGGVHPDRGRTGGHPRANLTRQKKGDRGSGDR